MQAAAMSGLLASGKWGDWGRQEVIPLRQPWKVAVTRGASRSETRQRNDRDAQRSRNPVPYQAFVPC